MLKYIAIKAFLFGLRQKFKVQIRNHTVDYEKQIVGDYTSLASVRTLLDLFFKKVLEELVNVSHFSEFPVYDTKITRKKYYSFYYNKADYVLYMSLPSIKNGKIKFMYKLIKLKNKTYYLKSVEENN